MESLRRLMSGKKDNPWETVLNKWEELLQPFRYSTLVVNKDWNPWKEWCRSWEMYEQSHSKTPKSGKERAAVWQELYKLAKFTEGRLDAVMGQQLTEKTSDLTNLQENLLLKTKCESLQKQLDLEAKHLEKQTIELTNLQKENLILKTKCEYEATAMGKRLETQTTELTNLQKENVILKTKCESLEEKLNYYQSKNVLDEHRHKKELEAEVNRRRLAENENKAIFKQCNDLERQILHVKQDMEDPRIYNYNQYHKHITFVNCRNHCLEGEESWHEKAKKAGVGCPSRDKIWNRLAYHENPNVTAYNATYWQLVIRLSRYEDLVTREAR